MISGGERSFLERHFCAFLFAAEFFLALALLCFARKDGLLGVPQPGMDQHTILLAAQDIAHGVLPVPGKYLYSPAYTLFLGALAVLTGGNLLWMRLLQAALCALIPVMIYRASRLAGASRTAAELAGILYLFCGSALLISLEFLRAAPLALCTVCWYGSLLRARHNFRCWYWSGVFAGLCILGRENFIPVVFLPFCCLLLPWFRKGCKAPLRAFCVYTGMLLLVLLPVLAYNFYHTGSIAILPGNGKNVFEFMQGKGSASAPLGAASRILTQLPCTLWSVVSPFENPNSLSLYAFREAIRFLKVLALPVTLLWGLGLTALCARRRNRALLLAGLLVAGYFGTLIFCEIYYRFRIPVLPLLCLLAGAGAAQLLEWGRQKEYRKLFLGSLPAVLALVIVSRTTPEVLLPQTERDATVRFLADHERFDEAAALLRKYRKLRVPSPAGERFLLHRAYRTGDSELFARIRQTIGFLE